MRSLVFVGITATLLGSRAVSQEIQRTAPTTPAAVATQASQPSPNASSPQIPESTPPKPSPLVENLRTFDPTTLNLMWENNRWILTAKDGVLKDFGRKELEGRQALRVIRMLQLNQYGTVGAPAPVMEYWLSDGVAPSGPVPGCPLITFDANTLHVEETQDQWCVRDDRRVLFNLGSRSEDARQAFAVLSKYGFGQVAVVGQPTPSMFVFLANPYRDKTAAGISRSPHQSTTHETPEVAARKAEELKRLKERIPALDAETVTQPALRTLRTPDQPRQPFSNNTREYGGEGISANRNMRSNVAADAGDRVPFDWRQVQIRLEHNEWQLAAGSQVLANFGPDQDAARRALDAVRYYRFTEQRLIGKPQRNFSYFLVNSAAPRNVPFGVPSVPFQPESLKVHEVEGRWALCSGDRPIIILGDRKEDAADLLEVIKRQHFDLFCQIGRAEDGFTFLVRTR